MTRESDFDVIVIGGGHAGCEAAHASAAMGCRTAMLSLRTDRIGFMSCNPAMGGLAKGQLIKEIDALGGIMAQITDRAAIQYRRLNASKGPAVRSSRAQCDKALYAIEMQNFLKDKVPNLKILNSEAREILTEAGQVTGVLLSDGSKLQSRAVIVTTGTFLRAIMFTGPETKEGGRVGDKASVGLSQSISDLGFKLRRLKTGTPPRLHKDSINFSVLEPQAGDEKPTPFSFYYDGLKFPHLPQVNCHITYTNQNTHEIIEADFERSPMFSGLITGVGPRYCPSIEDKVKRFRDKDRHQIFLEPEGLTSEEVYINGVSTSLPMDTQDKFIRSIKGLERAQFTKYGYAVEYDAVDATQLYITLETKSIQGLYFAGQINGTSGYEEAGAQGLVAGINAAQKVKGNDEFRMRRDNSYIGVMIDDLILKGSDEPYRMFTSRAEHRLTLREDNADLRLTPLGFELGLINATKLERFEAKRGQVKDWTNRLQKHYFLPNDSVNSWFETKGLYPLKDRVGASILLRRPEITWDELIELGFDGEAASEVVREQIEINIKYEGYIKRDQELLVGIKESEGYKIPADVEFNVIPGLSHEVIGKLSEIRPETLGQCGRIQGVTPAAVANILIYLKMRSNSARKGAIGLK